MQNYVGSGSFGGYNYETQLITYSAPNATRDVSIEDIIAPSKDANYVRHNPMCSSPLIKMRNTGSSSVSSVAFAYQVNSGAIMNYTWTGSLNYLDTMTVVLPPSSSLFTGTTTSSAFHVSVTAVNGLAGDDNTFNNAYHSKFDPVLVVPETFVLKFFTNNNAAENTWTLYDENDFALVSSNPMNNTTLYKDTILNLPPGCYRIVLNDYGCNGLNWWAAPSQGSGSFRIERLNGSSAFIFPVDFGCSFVKFFTVAAPQQTVDISGVSEGIAETNVVDIFPSPASESALLKLDLGHSQNILYSIADINGRVVSTKQLKQVASSYEKLDLSGLQAGLYFVTVQLQDNSKITRKLIVE